MDRTSMARISPLGLLIITTIALFVSEAVIMLFLGLLLPLLPLWLEVVLDAFVLISLGFLVLYFSLFRPMNLHILERERSEEKAKHAFNELNQIFQSAADGMLVIDKDFTVMRVNKTFEKLTGIRGEEAVGKKCHEVFPGLQCHTLLCPATKITHGEERVECETVKKNRDGSDIHCILTATPFCDPTGKLIGIVEDFKDITERKHAENEIRSLKQQIEFILGATKTGLDIIDEDFNIRYIDPEWQGVYGDPTGKKCYEYFTGRDKVCPSCGVLRACETKTMTSTEGILPKEGNRPVQINTIPFQNAEGEWLFAEICVDITERKKIEEERMKAQKLESLGLLAGGIAHDFNNLLTAIIGNIGFIKMNLVPGDESFSALKMAEKASLRAKDLTQQLITFSRGGEPIKKTASPSALIHESASFVLSGSNVRGDLQLPDGLAFVEVDEGQINQCLNNILLNAVQAMPEGGVVTIRGENITVGDNDSLPLTQGAYVKISIEDRGHGIPSKYLSKIFDPYFTTRQKESGLGLTTAYYIIRKHGGHIQVESSPGKGTTCHIFLPASRFPLKAKSKDTLLVPSGTGKILVMDDEEILRDFTSRILTKSGYDVELSSEGVEAIQRYREAKDSGCPFDVVIMDLTIPGGIGGKKTIRELLEIDPDIKAIVSSGYSDDPIMANYGEYGFKGVVAKPYTLEELLHAIRTVMGKPLAKN
ncbi:MAG: PAS domain-containing protein [Thermodesulfovibrionales bacterium]|nr:PAS domain-containing protein [Thermodesulfovibrionales bacterium]